MNYDTVEGKGLLPFDKVEKIILPFEIGELEGLYFLIH
jgi:hypothetical protein